MNESVWSLKSLLRESTLNTTNHLMPNEIYESTVFACLYIVIFLFGIVSNVLVIIVYSISDNFKNYTRYFFINLSISDIISLAICIPKAISDLYITGGWKFGFYYCKLIISLAKNYQSCLYEIFAFFVQHLSIKTQFGKVF